MREYETVFITQPNITEASQSQISGKIGTLIEKHNGKLFFARNMGRKNLAYPIKKETKGYYTCMDFAADGEVIKDIERYLKYEDNVIRYLTIVKDEKVDVEARAAEVVARGEDASLPFEQEASQPAVATAGTTEKKADAPVEEKVEVEVTEKVEVKAEVAEVKVAETEGETEATEVKEG